MCVGFLLGVDSINVFCARNFGEDCKNFWMLLLYAVCCLCFVSITRFQ